MELQTPKANPEPEKPNDETDSNGALKSALTTNTTSDTTRTILGNIDTAAVGLDGKDRDPPTTNNGNESHLLSAPAEIRNEVWLLALNIREPFCLNDILHCGAFHSKPRRFKIPSLLHINQQIRYETASLFYGKTAFLCHFSATTFTQCLSIVDIDHLKFLHNIECRSYDGTRSARLFLQVVLEMLGDRAKMIRKGVVKAALKTAKRGEDEVDWISLSEVQAWHEERKKLKDGGKLKWGLNCTLRLCE